MDSLQRFFSCHEDPRSAMTDRLPCPEAGWRARLHGVDPINRVVRHMARAEAGGLNRPVGDGPQVLDAPAARWPERRRLPHRHHGSTMPSAAVDARCD